MTKPRAFITSVDVCEGGGPNDYVNVFIRGQRVGTLVVGKGDAEPLQTLLLRELDHTKEAGQRAPAQSRRVARAGRSSTRAGAPSAAGARPTYRRDSEPPPGMP